MPFDARIAWVLAGAGALAAVALAAFPPAGLGDRLDFLFFHGAGFGPGTVFRFIAGLAVAAGAFAMARGGDPSRVWRRGRERLAIAPRAYAAIMAGIGAIAWLSVQGSDFRSLFNGRPVAIATHSGGGGHAVLAALRLQLAHLGAHVVGRQLVSNGSHPAKDDSIADLIHRLKQLQPLQF